MDFSWRVSKNVHHKIKLRQILLLTFKKILIKLIEGDFTYLMIS